MRTLSGLAGATLLLAGPTFAADLATSARAYNWSGFYVGGNAGGAWGYSDASTTTVFSSQGNSYLNPTSPSAIASAGALEMHPTGFTGGGEAGYNWQLGPLVLGAEIDLNYLGLKGSGSGSGFYPCCAPAGFTINSSVSTDWLFTARPRIGWAASNWLIYVTGGLAFGDVRGNFTFSDTSHGAIESGSFSTTKSGWTAGGGVEVGLQGPWTVKVEYLHVDLGGASTTSTNLSAFQGTPFPMNPFTHSIDVTANMVRAGLNYRF